MKALTLWQPWASLIAMKAKTIETRSWGTSYRGPILIHASAKWDRQQKALLSTTPFNQYFDGTQSIPLGMFVCKATLQDCIMITDDTYDTYIEITDRYAALHDVEFGDYTPGRFAWILSEIVPFSTPIPYKGAQGIWNVDTYRGTGLYYQTPEDPEPVYRLASSEYVLFPGTNLMANTRNGEMFTTVMDINNGQIDVISTEKLKKVRI